MTIIPCEYDGGGTQYWNSQVVSVTVNQAIAKHTSETITVTYSDADVVIPDGYSIVAVQRIVLGSGTTLRKYFQATVLSLSTVSTSLVVSNITDLDHTLDKVTIRLLLLKDTI